MIYDTLQTADWEQDFDVFSFTRNDQEHTHLSCPFLSSIEYRPPVTHRAAEVLTNQLDSQEEVLHRCIKLQTKLETKTCALAAILPLTLRETPKLESAEECYLNNAV